jgi:PAS domain S-box-containing protein
MADQSLDPIARLRELGQRAVILDPETRAEILDILPLGVIVIDKAGTMRYVSKHCETLFGYKLAAMEGQCVDMLVPESLRAVHAEHRRRFFTDPRVRPMGLGLELRGQQQDGTEIVLQIELAPLVTAYGLCAVASLWRQRDHVPPS